MIFVRDDDIFLNAIWRHQPFLKYKIKVDIGITTSRPFPTRWIKKHLNMYEICNHSHSHSGKNLVNWNTSKQKEDLEKANNIIKKKLGVEPRYFIPPYGKFDDKLIEVCESLGMILHPSYKMRETTEKKYFSAHKVDIIGKKDGWYVCHTSKGQPSKKRLEKNLFYLYENKLTRFWK